MKTSNTKERLKEMMSLLNIKPADICRRSNVQKSALSNYINGTREPRQDQISLICDPYGINPAWLMGYDVPMYMNTPAASSGSSPLEAKLLDCFHQLNPAGQAILVDQADTLVSSGKYLKETALSS